MTGTLHVVVIGAGIVGVSTAAYLRRDGHEVTLVDPEPPGTQTSFGNAGAISTHSCIPQTGPGILGQIPRYLLDPLGPLAIRWSYLPVLLPWFIRFVRAGRPEAMRREIEAMANLHRLALDAHRELAREAGLSDLIATNGSLAVYERTESFEADRGNRESMRGHGGVVEELDADELRQLEPDLSPIFRHAAFYPYGAHSINPGRLTTGLAEAYERAGGRIRSARVTGFVTGTGRPSAVETDEGPIAADAFVVCAGAWSGGLLRMLGERVSLESERGYHLTIPDPGTATRRPISFAERKFMATPMEMGLRLAGTAEFAGLRASPDWRRTGPLRRHAQAAFRGISFDGASRWSGHRPATPDSLPVLGRSGVHGNVYHAFGHGHLGLTAGPISGRHVADLIAGRTPAIDLAPYSAGRFR